MIHIRWMVRRDYEAVLACQKHQVVPVSEETLLTWLRQRNCIGMVAEVPPYDDYYNHGIVVGFMVYELRHDSLEILSFAADGKLSWKTMTDKLYSKLNTHRRICVTWDGVRVIRWDGHPLFLRTEELGAEMVDKLRRFPPSVRWDLLVDEGVLT